MLKRLRNPESPDASEALGKDTLRKYPLPKKAWTYCIAFRGYDKNIGPAKIVAVLYHPVLTGECLCDDAFKDALDDEGINTLGRQAFHTYQEAQADFCSKYKEQMVDGLD